MGRLKVSKCSVPAVIRAQTEMFPCAAVAVINWNLTIRLHGNRPVNSYLAKSFIRCNNQQMKSTKMMRPSHRC